MMETIKQYFSCQIFQYFLFASFLVGAVKTIMLFVGIMIPFTIKRLNLKKRYNGGWALVTGGSQGIGYALAEELAKEGFHIILVSRSKVKLESAQKKLIILNPNIKVEFKSIDFQKITKEEQYYNEFEQFFEKDISVLVNNVGYFLPYDFVQKSFGQYRRQIKINCLPITVLTRFFIQRMIKRENRSAIINLGSISSDVIFAGASNYGATKRFDAYLSQALAYQYKNKIDILTAKPFFVTTSMIRNLNSFMNVSAEQSAKAIINSLGRFSVVFGPFIHNLQGLFIEHIYHGLVTFMSNINFLEFRKRYNQKIVEQDQRHLEISLRKNKQQINNQI